MSQAPLRAAIIGTGGIAREHVLGLRAHPEKCTVIAAADTHPANLNAFCDTHTIPERFGTADEMLRAVNPDVVVVCTPPFTHAALAVQALEHGAHVVCEKPMVIALAELDQIAHAESRSARTCSSIFQWRFGSAAKHVKHLIGSGTVGRPLVGIANTLWYRHQSYYTGLPWRGKWRTEGGGAALGHGIHAMDLALWLMGEWAEVDAQIETVNREIEIETVALARVKFTHGAYGCFTTSVVSPREVSYLRLDCERATIELEHLYRYENQHWRFTALADQTLPEGWATIPADLPGNMAAQWGDTLTDLLAGRRPTTVTEAVRPTYDFVASMYKSALTRQPVRRGSIHPDDPFYHAMNGQR